MTARLAGLAVAACLLLGALQGMLWALLAPGATYRVLADGRYFPLPGATANYFAGIALFALSGIAVGVLVAVAGWRVRPARGWPMLLTLVGASVLGALLAWWLGRLLAPGTDPASVGVTDAGSVVTTAAHLDTLLVLVAQPFAVAAVTTVLAAWDGRPDLGTGRVPMGVTPEVAGTRRTDP